MAEYSKNNFHRLHKTVLYYVALLIKPCNQNQCRCMLTDGKKKCLCKTKLSNTAVDEIALKCFEVCCYH